MNRKDRERGVLERAMKAVPDDLLKYDVFYRDSEEVWFPWPSRNQRPYAIELDKDGWFNAEPIGDQPPGTWRYAGTIFRNP